MIARRWFLALALIAGSTKSRIRGPRPGFCGLRPGQSASAATIAIGYSATVVKTSGAIKALNAPPRTPPADIQR